MRLVKAYLNDILNSIRKIENYTENLSYENFVNDELIQDGVVRNLEIIGEAVKNLPKEIKNKIPEIEWKKISGMRDILIHEYFGIDFEILWEIVKDKLPEFKRKILEISSEIDEEK